MSLNRILDPGYYEDEIDPNTLGFTSNPLQFQCPPFLNDGYSTLAVGGGVEVVSPATFNSLSASSTWYAPAPPTTKNSDDSFEKEYTTLRDESPLSPFDYQHQQQSIPSELSAASPIPVYSNASLLSTMIPPPPMTHDGHAHLHLYSQSGFDITGVLGRVANRPNPQVELGPVDMSASIVVVDVRKWDCPIVYCSPTFVALTGYSEREACGRNCRFLQSPTGDVKQGEVRQHSQSDVVKSIRKSLVGNKECQVTITNFKKGGQAFLNRLTVIPITGPDSDEIVYHVGFQIDLDTQSKAIIGNILAGSYTTNHPRMTSVPSTEVLRDRKANNVIPLAPMSNIFRTMLDDPVFLHSLPAHTATYEPKWTKTNQFLSLLLLEASPDCMHILSLKGEILYCASTVRRMLGYEPEELLGKHVQDFCFPADRAAFERDLKAASAPAPADMAQSHHPYSSQLSNAPRTVDLLFRIRKSDGQYVWLECRGRLHVEAGKNRRAIFLSGRIRHMPAFDWGAVASAGGIGQPIQTIIAEGATVTSECEFWGMLSTQGTFLSVGQGVKDVLGWTSRELVGTHVGNLVALSDDPVRDTSNPRQIIGDEISRFVSTQRQEPKVLLCTMLLKGGGFVNVKLVLFPSKPTQPSSPSATYLTTAAASSQLGYQIRLFDPRQLPPPIIQSVAQPPHTSVFRELETARDTTWSLELNNLKNSNESLRDEIAILEAMNNLPQQPPTLVSQQQPQTSFAGAQVVHERRRISSSNRMQTHQPQSQTTTWSTPYYQTSPMSGHKRSWDGNPS